MLEIMVRDNYSLVRTEVGLKLRQFDFSVKGKIIITLLELCALWSNWAKMSY